MTRTVGLGEGDPNWSDRRPPMEKRQGQAAEGEGLNMETQSHASGKFKSISYGLYTFNHFSEWYFGGWRQ